MVPRLKRVMQGTYRLSTKYTFNVHFIRSFLPPLVNVYYFFHTLSIFIYFQFLKIASIGFQSLKIHDMDSSNRLQYLSCKLQATISAADAHKLQIAKVSGWIQLFSRVKVRLTLHFDDYFARQFQWSLPTLEDIAFLIWCHIIKSLHWLLPFKSSKMGSPNLDHLLMVWNQWYESSKKVFYIIISK